MKVNKISSSKAFVFSKSLGGKKIGGLRPPSGTVEVTLRGGARGGLGAIAPPLEHASPPSEGEKRFFRRFLAFIVP